MACITGVVTLIGAILSNFGHLCLVNHVFNLPSVSRVVNGGASLVRIPVRIIPKGVLSFRAKWCADFSNTPLMNCGFIVFWVGVWNSDLCDIYSHSIVSAPPRFCVLGAFRATLSHSCRLVIGEYLLSVRSVGTHLELSGVSSSWDSPMGSILPDMGSKGSDLRFCNYIAME